MDEDIWKVVSYIRREQAKSAGISLDIFIASSSLSDLRFSIM
jgi:hypothetical protein